MFKKGQNKTIITNTKISCPITSFFSSTHIVRPHCTRGPQDEKIISEYTQRSSSSSTRSNKRLKSRDELENEIDHNTTALSPSTRFLNEENFEVHFEPQSSSHRNKEDEGDKFRSKQKKLKFDKNCDSAEENEDVENELSVGKELIYGTDLEAVLPTILIKNNTEDLVEEYENLRDTDNLPPKLEYQLSEVDNNHNFNTLDDNWSIGGRSIYVDAFNLALQTVLENESHLFDTKELEIFKKWKEMNYEAQFLYVRLFLRKSSVWHRINSLKYHYDISDISAAVKELQCSRSLPHSCIESVSDTNLTELPFIENWAELGSSFKFADSSAEEIKTLEEILPLLTLEELKAVSKDAKVCGRNKLELLQALCRTSKYQSGLSWPNKEQQDSSCGWKNQPLPEANSCDALERRISVATLDQHFYQKFMKIIGPCIRLSSSILKIFERVHLVFYRSSEWTEKSLITMILAQMSRRNFPKYIVSRSKNIFASRSDLLEFEAALQIQFRVDQLLVETNDSQPNQIKKFDEILIIVYQIYPRWKILIQEKKNDIYHGNDNVNSHRLLHESCKEDVYLCRFSPGWVYTRIVHKGIFVLGRLKRYAEEYDLISELLDQNFFHPARRGAWYQRKALLEEHYMYKIRPLGEILDVKLQKNHWKHIALRTCEAGLQDRDCHQIFHYDLQKRICKLEKHMKIPKREKHDFGHVLLLKPTEVWISGIQVLKEYTSNSDRSCLHKERARSGTSKTIWINQLEGGEECSVEKMCLSWYRSHGYKGYHCEGSIIHTLFAYLFYDILFIYVPNVFQTAYQTCPLDLFTDAFFPSRASEINHRLAAIENGLAATLIENVNARERHKNTYIIGLNWDFDLADLLEIVACFDARALAAICRVLAQEYRIRRCGMPDLFLWHVERREVIFAEVKSANDRLSETQRLWVHVMTGAGLRVELCHAVAKEVKRVKFYSS